MHRLGPRRSLVLGLLVALVVGVLAPLGSASSYAGSAASPGRQERHQGGLVGRIERLGVVDEVREVRELAWGGTRFFRIWFRLPVDHDRPDGRHFRLRGTLVSRGTGRPTVVATSGYGLRSWQGASPDEVTGLVDGNRLDLEHRFFRPSRPARPDWATQATIQQAAADLHLVVRALQRIYTRPWLSTGASKGGMTMTYFRRFYPRDVAGTVAYVAPDDVVDSEDSAYDDFLATVGGERFASCRAALVAAQRTILEDRDWFVDEVQDMVAADGGHLSLVGGADRAVEVAVIETYFAFWQYLPAVDFCPQVPGPSASDQDLWDWVDEVLGWSYVEDEATRYYIPYYYQAARQLGAPAPYEAPLADLLRHPGHDVPATYLPDRLQPVPFDAEAMPDVDRWVRHHGSRMLFVYGDLDPWSAEPFTCGTGGADRQCVVNYVPGGNHGSKIYLLPRAKRRAAVALVRSWAGLGDSRVQPAPPTSSASASRGECRPGVPCSAR